MSKKGYPNIDFLEVLPKKNKKGWLWTEETDPSIYNDTIEWPKISIITPSLNQGQFIEETIRSVLLQNYPNLEYIIIDGGSTDNSVEIIKRYEKWITYWVSETDSGQSHAINKGFMHCTGEITNWLNSDDQLTPGALQVIANSFSGDDIDIVSGRESHFGSRGTEELKYGTIIYPTLEENLFYGIIYQPSTFWRTKCFRELLPVNENLNYLMDAELWIRYLLIYGLVKVKKIDNVLAKFRLHQNSKTANLKHEFEEERNHLRSHLLLILNFQKNIPGFNIHNFEKGMLKWEIKQKINVQRLASIFYEDSIKRSYADYDYSQTKKLLRDKPIYSTRDVLYFLKLYSIPPKILNLIRGL